MPTVRVKENEPFEVAMRRFKRTVEKTGLLTELRAREYYEKPTAERKRKLAAAFLQTMCCRQRQTGTRHAERMTERDRTAMRINVRGIIGKPELPQAG